MKYLKFIYIAIPVLFLSYYVLFTVNKDGDAQKPAEQKLLSQDNLETVTDKQGPVTVKVTPRSLKNNQWVFDIILDTHSVELNYDAMQLAELIGVDGKIYKPISWRGDAPSGHHREVTVTFTPITPKPSSVELRIKGVGGIAERLFKWNSSD